MCAVAQLDNRSGAVLMPLIIETPRPADYWWYDPACAAMVGAVAAVPLSVVWAASQGLLVVAAVMFILTTLVLLGALPFVSWWPG